MSCVIPLFLLFPTHTSRPRLSSDVAHVQTRNLAGFLATHAVVVHVISQVRLRQLLVNLQKNACQTPELVVMRDHHQLEVPLLPSVLDDLNERIN